MKKHILTSCFFSSFFTILATGIASAALPPTVFQGASPLDAYVGTYSNGKMTTELVGAPALNWCKASFDGQFSIKKEQDGKYYIEGKVKRDPDGCYSVLNLCDDVCPTEATIKNEVTLDADKTSARFSVDRDYNDKNYDKDQDWSCKLNTEDPNGDACVSVKLNGSSLVTHSDNATAKTPFAPKLTGTYTFNAEKVVKK